MIQTDSKTINPMDIKIGLMENRLNYTWLSFQLEKRGLSYDKTTIAGVVTGTIKGPRSIVILENSKEILDDYEKRMNG